MIRIQGVLKGCASDVLPWICPEVPTEAYCLAWLLCI